MIGLGSSSAAAPGTEVSSPAGAGAAGALPVLSACFSVLSTSQDTEIRRRTVGENLRLSPHKDESMKSENSEEDDDNMVTTWKPFLVNICMFTFLTAGAYLCYRVCFH